MFITYGSWTAFWALDDATEMSQQANGASYAMPQALILKARGKNITQWSLIISHTLTQPKSNFISPLLPNIKFTYKIHKSSLIHSLSLVLQNKIFYFKKINKLVIKKNITIVK